MKHLLVNSKICCRKESIFNLGSAETKLLYTLHWVLLDAMDECSLEEKERGNNNYNDFNLPLSSITVRNVIQLRDSNLNNSNYSNLALVLKTTCCRHLCICLHQYVETLEKLILMQICDLSMVAKFGLQCGSTDILMWIASQLRYLCELSNYSFCHFGKETVFHFILDFYQYLCP